MFKKIATAFLALLIAAVPLAGTVSAALTTNPINNASAETGTATTATGWNQSGWSTDGKQTPAYEVVTGGAHQGNKSLKVTMTNYSVDGDAKWYFDPISTSTLAVGSQYRLNLWYKSNVIPKVVTYFVMADGTEKYFGMPAPQPAANSTTVWQKYSDTFSVPQGASAVSAFMFIDQNGWVQTDDYSIESYTPSGFNEGILTMTFDDGHEENSTNALPLLQQYGYKSTQCFATTFLEGMPQATLDKALAFKNAGHEICSHSVTHPMMTTLDAATLDYEAKHSQEYLQSLIGGPVPNFATPFGDYNGNVNKTLKKYYQAHRSVDEGYNSKDNFDAFRLRVQNIFSTTTAAEVAAWSKQAKDDKTWLILVYHRIANDPGTYDSYIADFQAQLAAIQASGIKVATYQDALMELKGQMGGQLPSAPSVPFVPATPTNPGNGGQVAGSSTAGNNRNLRNTGSASLGYVAHYMDAETNAIPLTGDWDADRDSDFGSVTGNTWTLRMPNGTNWSTTLGNGITNGDVPIVGDWDANGKTDFGIVNGSTWTLRMPSGETWTTEFGTDDVNNIPMTGDWDADGRSDFGIINGSTWTIRFANGDTWSMTYGNGIDAGDTPMTGDWNADGKTDFGIIRGNTWTLRMPSGETWDTTFGDADAGDIPIVGDWDKNGKTDFGVVNGSTWTIRMPHGGVWTTDF